MTKQELQAKHEQELILTLAQQKKLDDRVKELTVILQTLKAVEATEDVEAPTA